MGAYNGNGENNMASTATRTSVLTIQDKTVTGVAIDPESRAITECDELRIPFKTIVHRDFLTLLIVSGEESGGAGSSSS